MKKTLIWIVVICVYLCVPALITLAVSGKADTEFESGEIYGPRVNVQYGSAVKTVEVNKFVEMVLASVYEENDKPEMLKALGIVVRTNIYRIMGDKKEIDSDELAMNYYTSSEMRDEWGSSYQERAQIIKESVSATGQRVIKYSGNLIDARFTRLTNGKTLSGSKYLGEEYAYLKEVDCPKDMENENFYTHVTFKGKELAKLINNKYKNANIREDNAAQDIQIVSKTEDGYIVKLQIGNAVIGGEAFASMVGVKSAFFTIETRNEGSVRIVSKGDGTGLGMSLNTANSMAAQDSTYTDIIQNFFDNVEVISLE